VLVWLQQYNPVKVEYKYLDREHNLKELANEPNYSAKEIVEAMDTILAR